MRLEEFLERFGSLDDAAFQAGFNHPFLLQEGKLKLEGGGPADRHVYLLRPPPGGKLVVGRTHTVEVSIPDKQVSSKHAELWERDGRWFVRLVVSYAFRDATGRFRTQDEQRWILRDVAGAVRYEGRWQQ